MEKKKIDWRVMFHILIMALAVAALSACASQATPTAAPAATEESSSTTASEPEAEPITLEVWMQEASIGSMETSTEAFKEMFPNIDINFVPTPIGDTSTKLVAAIAANSGIPDIAFIQYNDMINFTDLGGVGLSDLSPFFGPAKDEWIGWSLDLVTTKEGKLIGFPADIGTTATFFNRSVFEKAGLDSDPESVAEMFATWGSFMETGKTLAENDVFLVHNASAVFELMRQQGVQAYFDENGEPIVNSKQFVDAATLAQEVRRAGLDGGGVGMWSEEFNSGIIDGTYATINIAAWWDIILHLWAPDSGGAWGVVASPEGAVGNMGGSYFVFPEASENQEAAFAFVDFVRGSGEGIMLDLEVNKFLQAYKPLYETELWTASDPFYGDQAWLPIFSDAAERGPEIRSTVNDALAAEVVSQAISDILDNDADPQTRLDEANETIKNRVGY